MTTIGYTVLVCSADGCGSPLYDPLILALRNVVGTSRFGVLVVGGCTLGGVACRLREPAPLIVVQPCDGQRNPLGPAIRVGPVRAPDDITEIVGWLRCGRFAVGDLPGHLVSTHRALGAAVAN